MSGIIGSKARSSGVVGNINLFDEVLQRPEIKDYGESVNAIGTPSDPQNIDLTLGNVVTATLGAGTGGETTFAFINPSPTGKACSFTLILTQDGTGSRTVDWPGSVQWAGSSAPTLSTGDGDVDIFAFVTVDAGTTWFGFTGGLNLDI